MLLAERYLQTQLRLETAPRFTTDASSDTLHITSDSLHLQYQRLYFSDNSFSLSGTARRKRAVREAGRHLSPSFFCLSMFKHWAQRNKACSLRGVRKWKTLHHLLPSYMFSCWSVIKAQSSELSLRLKKIRLPHPKLYFTNTAWTSQTIKLSFFWSLEIMFLYTKKPVP